MNNVKLTISGAAKTGKTTVLRYVVEKLQDAGCNVTVHLSAEDQTDLKWRPEVLQGLNVEISEHQMRKEGPNDPKLSDCGARRGSCVVGRRESDRT